MLVIDDVLAHKPLDIPTLGLSLLTPDKVLVVLFFVVEYASSMSTTAPLQAVVVTELPAKAIGEIEVADVFALDVTVEPFPNNLWLA